MPKVFDKIMFYDVLQLSSYSGGWYKIPNIHKAEEFCKNMATSHYENFPVGSILIPKKNRQDIYNIYSFARTADDIADTLLEFNTNERLSILENYLNNLRIYVRDFDKPKHNKPLFNPTLLASARTIRELNLPISLNERLIHAFAMDANFKSPDTFEDLLNYCSFSANPIGEIILRIFDLYNESTIKYSNDICTALQLANFWQDFSVDLPNGRCYIPAEILEKYDLNVNNKIDWHKHPNFILVLQELYNYTDNLFNSGINLLKYLKPYRLKLEIETTVRGGKLILEKSKELKEDILIRRPIINKINFIPLLIKSLLFIKMKPI